jgi:hypothetical protein
MASGAQGQEGMVDGGEHATDHGQVRALHDSDAGTMNIIFRAQYSYRLHHRTVVHTTKVVQCAVWTHRSAHSGSAPCGANSAHTSRVNVLKPEPDHHGLTCRCVQTSERYQIPTHLAREIAWDVTCVHVLTDCKRSNTEQATTG